MEDLMGLDLGPDPEPLRCVGNVHVPGCEHTSPLRPEDVSTVVGNPAAFIPRRIALGMVGIEPDPPIAAFAIQQRDGLTLVLDVNLTRRGRAKCPVCHRRRQLLRLTAFSAAQPVGYGESRCLECAGLRQR